MLYSIHYERQVFMMSKKILILLLSVVLLLAISLYGYKGFHKTSAASVIVPDEDAPLRDHIIQLEKNLAATNVLKMTFEELTSQTEPMIHPFYKETYFDNLKKSYEIRSLIPYITEPPYEQFISKVYTNKDGTIKQVFVKSSEISAINAVDKTPVAGTKSLVAKSYVFKKDDGQWKIFSVSNSVISISRNEPKRVIEKFANYDNEPIEYESITVLE